MLPVVAFLTNTGNIHALVSATLVLSPGQAAGTVCTTTKGCYCFSLFLFSNWASIKHIPVSFVVEQYLVQHLSLLHPKLHLNDHYGTILYQQISFKDQNNAMNLSNKYFLISSWILLPFQTTKNK